MSIEFIIVFVLGCLVSIWQLFVNMKKRLIRKYFIYISHFIIFSLLTWAAIASSECLTGRKGLEILPAVFVGIFWVWLCISTSLWILWDARENKYEFAKGTYPIAFLLSFLFMPFYLFKAKRFWEAATIMFLVIPAYIAVMSMSPIVILFR